MARNWTNDNIYRLIELYKNEPMIWNPRHIDHKDKYKVKDAWSRVSLSMNISVSELKKKKETLMTAFRTNLKKKNISIRSKGKVHKPIWIFYDAMEAFLKDIYDCPRVAKTEVLEPNPEVSDKADDKTSKPNRTAISVKRRRSSNLPELQVPKKQMKHVLSNASKKEDDDDSALYGRLLASKLREFSNDERRELMYDIDGLILQRLRNRRISSTPLDFYPSSNIDSDDS